MSAMQYIRNMLRNTAGSMAIETALVAPVLMVMSVGAFEASTMVARQTELQSAAAEVAAIVRASPPETSAQRTTIRDIVATSTGVQPEQVAVSEVYRCGTAESYVESSALCGSDAFSTYIQVTITDEYHPLWTQFGIGGLIAYTVQRTVQIG